MSNNLSNAGIIDWADLDSRLGDEQIIVKIIATFIKDNTARMKLLFEAAQAGNVNDVAYYAHSLKGASATVGAKALEKTAEKLEIMAGQDNLNKAWPVLQSLQAEFDRVESFLAKPDWIQIAKAQANDRAVT